MHQWTGLIVRRNCSTDLSELWTLPFPATRYVVVVNCRKSSTDPQRCRIWLHQEPISWSTLRLTIGWTFWLMHCVHLLPALVRKCTLVRRKSFTKPVSCEERWRRLGCCDYHETVAKYREKIRYSTYTAPIRCHMVRTLHNIELTIITTMQRPMLWNSQTGTITVDKLVLCLGWNVRLIA